MPENQAFRSGFIPIVGRPNVGKSSLMNAMIGEKVAIVSSRPQTTRNRIMGVVTRPGSQFVFLDTPGIHQPKNRLGEYMMHSVNEAMEGMDCVLTVVDVTSIGARDLEIAGKMAGKKVPSILALNKIDLVRPDAILAATARFSEMAFDEIIPVSARTRSGLDELVACLESYLPAGPQYFPEDMMTDQPERLLCAEIIREKALRNLREEVPHGIGVEIMRIEDQDGCMNIHATLYCEKESHKGIIIGRHGAMLKEIGSQARADMERLLNTHVNLELWVKVRPEWRNNVTDLRTLGYDIKSR